MIRIDVLPDDVLLEIFDFYMNMHPSDEWKTEIEAWQSLVHVCRRWRSLVFQSPRRLNLRLFCTPDTPARDTLDVWPPLPLLIVGMSSLTPCVDNVIAALEQSNRVCQVKLYLPNWDMEKVLAAMQVPFPELTNLQLMSLEETPPVIPDSFLVGSAPRLRSFSLSGIPFPGLPKLLLSANHLVHLYLYRIPHSAYISPEEMVALISVLSGLSTLYLEFQSPLSQPDSESRSLPPPKRSIFPALDKFHFNGVTEYLEDLVTHIDTPQLDEMDITFFSEIDFDCPRLAQFINRTPTLWPRDEAHLQLDDCYASVTLPSRHRTLRIGILHGEPFWQIWSVGRICISSLPPLSTIEDLYIERRLGYINLAWKNAYASDVIENAPWLQLLLPFTAVKNLYLSKEFAPVIAVALQELIGDGITAVLPSLQNIFVEGLEPLGPVEENIRQFVAARQFSDHPIAISDWDILSGIWWR